MRSYHTRVALLKSRVKRAEQVFRARAHRSNDRYLRANLKQKCVKIGLKKDSATTAGSASSLMGLMRWWIKVLLIGNINQSTANSSTRSYIAHMEIDVSSFMEENRLMNHFATFTFRWCITGLLIKLRSPDSLPSSNFNETIRLSPSMAVYLYYLFVN